MKCCYFYPVEKLFQNRNFNNKFSDKTILYSLKDTLERSVLIPEVSLNEFSSIKVAKKKKKNYRSKCVFYVFKKRNCVPNFVFISYVKKAIKLKIYINKKYIIFLNYFL